jgi:hypothetical protein
MPSGQHGAAHQLRRLRIPLLVGRDGDLERGPADRAGEQIGLQRHALCRDGRSHGHGADRHGQRRKSAVESDVWVTTYWQLPKRLALADSDEPGGTNPGAAEKSKPKAVSLVDTSQGRKRRAELKWIGEEAITIAGLHKTCDHYRLSGDVQVDLWYDADRRLVRQESIDEGHKTVLQVKKIAAE